MLRDSVVVVVERTRLRAILLAMITMRKSIHGFPFVSHMSMGLRAAGGLLQSTWWDIFETWTAGSQRGLRACQPPSRKFQNKTF